MNYGWFNPTGESGGANAEATPEPPCPHGELSEHEAVIALRDAYGGSFSGQNERLQRAGYRLVRVKA